MTSFAVLALIFICVIPFGVSEVISRYKELKNPAFYHEYTKPGKKALMYSVSALGTFLILASAVFFPMFCVCLLIRMALRMNC